MKKLFAIAALAACIGIVSCVKTPAEIIDISASPAAVTLDSNGDTIRIAVTTSSETFRVETEAQWLSYQVNGKEIALSATYNDTKEERSTVVRISDDHSFCIVEVSQQVDSSVVGYKALATASVNYVGTLMYMYCKPLTEDYGGMATMICTDLDGNELELVFYTPLYLSAEEVELPYGEYTVGKDKMLEFYAVPFTWIPGDIVSLEGEDTSYGSVLYTNNEEIILLVSGTMTVKDGIITIDMEDAEGNEYRYAYDGDLEVNTDNATYPVKGIDPSNNILSITCSYNGINEVGALSMTLMVYAGENRMDRNISIFEFNMPVAEFSDTMDLSGVYTSPETAEDQGKAGTVNLGYYVEEEGFSYPKGTSIIFSDGNMWAADGKVNLYLEKTENGEYRLMASMADSAGTMYLFLPQKSFPIYLEDASQGM